MRIKRHTDGDGAIVGYTMWLSARDTYDWAHRDGARWPCSATSDRRLVVGVDGNGIHGLAVDGHEDHDGDIGSDELGAIVADHLPADCRHLWPTWEGVSKFKGLDYH